jgi:hypothetical protein
MIMLGALFGLGAALCWGTSDFVGGLQSRRFPVLTVNGAWSYSLDLVTGTVSLAGSA